MIYLNQIKYVNEGDEMSRKNSILLTLSQIAIGGVLTVTGSFIYLLFFKKFLWGLLIADRVTHGFWVGLFLLISIGTTYGAIIVGVSEGIRFVGRKFGIDIPFKPVYSGAFLGAPAIVGLLSLQNVPWDIFGTGNIILNLILPVFQAIAFILSLPIRAWLLLGFPVFLLYVLAIPIGAIIGYRLSTIDDAEVNAQET